MYILTQHINLNLMNQGTRISRLNVALITFSVMIKQKISKKIYREFKDKYLERSPVTLNPYY